jgi:putative acetyltransferase
MIRLYSPPADLEPVMAIWIAANIAGHPFIPPAHWESMTGMVRHLFLPWARTFVYDAGQVNGFISILEGGFIGGLFVQPALFRRSIGRELVVYAQAHYPELSLQVYAQNTGALAFYTAMGFAAEEAGMDAATGEAEYVMRWQRQTTPGNQEVTPI